MLERWPQVCRVKITFTLLPTIFFVFTTMNSMKYLVNWIPLRIRGRSRNTQPHLKKRNRLAHAPALSESVAMPTSDFVRGRNFFLVALRSGSLLTSRQKVKRPRSDLGHLLCKDLDLSLLCILILAAYSKFASKNNCLALSVCYPQPCSSAGRRFAASGLRLRDY